MTSKGIVDASFDFWLGGAATAGCENRTRQTPGGHRGTCSQGGRGQQILCLQGLIEDESLGRSVWDGKVWVLLCGVRWFRVSVSRLAIQVQRRFHGNPFCPLHLKPGLDSSLIRLGLAYKTTAPAKATKSLATSRHPLPSKSVRDVVEGEEGGVTKTRRSCSAAEAAVVNQSTKV